MATTSKYGPKSRGTAGTTSADLRNIELPPDRKNDGKKRIEKDPIEKNPILVGKLIDFEDKKVADRYKRLIERERKAVGTNVVTISRPRTKLDPIAKAVLDELAANLITQSHKAKKKMGDLPTPERLERLVRAKITDLGIATAIKKVTDRLNARHMKQSRRWVLTVSYVFLLWELFEGRSAENIKELMKDDLGVAERIMFDLEDQDGPFDVFTNMIVDSVMDRNRITKSETLVALVSQRVRAAV